MTYTFTSTTADLETIVFNIPNGPSLVGLQLWNEESNLILNAAAVLPTISDDWWNNETGTLVMDLVYTNDRYTEYDFRIGSGGIQNLSVVFLNAIKGIYSYKLINLDSGLEEVLEMGSIKIKNTLPSTSPNLTTYQSSNEERTGYVFLNQKSL